MSLPAWPRDLLLLPAAFAAIGTDPARASEIEDLVAGVSQAQIEEHVAALAALERWTADGQAQARGYIRTALESYGYPVSTDGAGNVAAERTGAVDPDRIFVLGAHYDAFAGTPGADDNASGVAGMLEVARAFADSAFAASVQFVAFAEEEPGLVGSSYFAETLVASGADVLGMISLEMIGFTDGEQFVFPDFEDCLDASPPEDQDAPDFVAVVSTSGAMADRFTSAAASYVPALRTAYGKVLDGYGLCLPPTRRSDHAPFWDADIPAILLTDTAEFRNPNYHQATDTPETLDLAFTRNVSAATAAFIAEEVRPASEPGHALLLAAAAATLAVWRYVTRRRASSP